MSSRGVNKVILIGNLGQDPEVRYTPNGVAIANLRLATSESWKDQQGQTQERTEWHRVVMYRRLAEIAGEYVKKGSKVYIEGKLQTRKWQDKDGQDRYTTEIVADEMQMLDGRPGAGDGAPRQGGGQYNQQPSYNQAPPAQNYGGGGSNYGGGNRNQGGQGNQGNYGNAPAQQPQQNNPGAGFAEPNLDFDDDIPF